MQFVRLFRPITINRVQIANRIVMPAMALLYTRDYVFNDRYRAFYRERARGGVGLMVVGPFAIDRVGSNPFAPGLFEDAFVAPLRSFVDQIHHESEAKVGIQLMQMGRYASSRYSGLTPIVLRPSPAD